MTAGAEGKARRGRGACVDLMEGPAWALLCVLLLADWGSAQHEEHTASFNSSSSSTVTPGASSAGPAVPSSLAPDAGAALNRSDPGPGPTAAAGRSSANVTSTLPPPPSPDPENRTHLLTTASSSRSSTPLHPTETPGEVAPTSAVLPTTSVGKALQGTPTVTPPVTPPLTSEPANTTSASRTSQSSAPSTGPPRGAPSSASTPITSPQSTHRPETPTVSRPATTTTTTTTATTVATPTGTSSQAKPHTNGPSQLNMGGNTTVLQRAPTPDPLLAGLVSAFVITAIILTLLVFLKLRRRNSQPEFHRLQDLPMDDMEDTPLSMYSY